MTTCQVKEKQNPARQLQVSNPPCAAEPPHQAGPTDLGHQRQELGHGKELVGRQTCKSAAAWPHWQPPHCHDAHLSLGMGGWWGEPGGAGTSKTLPLEQGMCRRGQGHPGMASVPQGVGMARAWPPAAPHRPLPCTHKFLSASSQKNLSRHSSKETHIILEQSSYDWSDFHNICSANICLLLKARLHWDRS